MSPKLSSNFLIPLNTHALRKPNTLKWVTLSRHTLFQTPMTAALPITKLPSSNFLSWRSLLLTAVSASENRLPRLLEALSLSVTSGHLLIDPFFSSRLVSALSSLSLALADLLFSHLPAPSPFAFNSLIRAHSSAGPTTPNSLLLFRLMLRSSLRPDRFTFPFLLRSSPVSAPALHSLSLRLGLDLDPHVATSLLHSYSSLGLFSSALHVFDEMPVKTSVTWNAVISCFAKSGSAQYQEHGLSLLRDLLFCSCGGDVGPNADIFASVLSCCAGLGALGHGKCVHRMAMRILDGLSLEVGTALIHMYSKCGGLDSGRRVFEIMQGRDVSAWTAMIGGLAMHGRGEQAVELFQRMVTEEKLMPDSLVFTSVLHACSHSGLLDKGIGIFNNMKDKYKIQPRTEHYGAMVDLFGRAGRLQEAERVVKSMPLRPNRIGLGSLLHACVVHGEVEFGKRLEGQVVVLEEEDGSGFYIGVSNVYAKEGKWDEVGKVRNKMMERGVRKEGGYSLLEVNGRVHKFLVGDVNNSLAEEMRSLLCGINKEITYA